MNVKCPHCGTEQEIDAKRMYRYIKCVKCTEGFVAGATDSLTSKKSEEKAESRFRVRRENTVTDEAAMADARLRGLLAPQHESEPNPYEYRSVTAAEQRVKVFEEMQRKKARSKMLRNFLESLSLLALLVVVIGACLAWKTHKVKLEAEQARIRAEEEAEKIRLEEERDRLERERRENDRIEHERARAEQEKREQERLRESQRAKREQTENEERYQMFLGAMRENKFDLFGKSVTNTLSVAGGALCYLFPSEAQPAPLYWAVYATNSEVSVYRLDADATKTPMDIEIFKARVSGSEYLVVKGDTVYYHSLQKRPGVGMLSKTSESDPADVFFGNMRDTLKWLRPTYDELTFDIIFTPKNTKKKIVVENLEFGCTYSLDKVREAIEKENPPSSVVAGYGFGAPKRKFKRTVVFYNGAVVKQGVDGITYIPRTPPPERTTYTTYHGGGWYGYTRERVRTTNRLSEWQALADRARQEEAAEQEFYERQKESASKSRARAQSEAETAWRKKIDKIFQEGTLSYAIRKANVDK